MICIEFIHYSTGELGSIIASYSVFAGGRIYPGFLWIIKFFNKFGAQESMLITY
jgi:hypothetical protein